MYRIVHIHHGRYICFAQSTAGIFTIPFQHLISHRRMDHGGGTGFHLPLGQGKARAHGVDDRMGVAVLYTSAYYYPWLYPCAPEQEKNS